MLCVYWALTITNLIKNSIIIEVSHTIRVFIHLFIKQGERSKTLPSLLQTVAWLLNKRKLNKRAWRVFQGNHTLDTFVIVTPPDTLLKLIHLALSLNFKLGEFLSHFHAIRALELIEFIIVLLLLWTFHFISIANHPTVFQVPYS